MLIRPNKTYLWFIVNKKDKLNKVDELYIDSKITNADIALRSYKLSNNESL